LLNLPPDLLSAAPDAIVVQKTEDAIGNHSRMDSIAKWLPSSISSTLYSADLS